MQLQYCLSIRRVIVAAVLTVTPSLPGLLAFPLLAVSSQPAFGQTRGAPSPPAPPPPADGHPSPAGARLDPDGLVPPAGDSLAAALANLPPPAPGETWVEVSLAEQKVRVFNGRDVVREMPASTGVADSPTPAGSFRLENRGEWFFSEKYRQGGWYWVSFKDWGVYLFHSVPTDREKRIIPEEATLLGVPASHGCVRLALEDARWVYETLPEGTRVEIHG